MRPQKASIPVHIEMIRPRTGMQLLTLGRTVTRRHALTALVLAAAMTAAVCARAEDAVPLPQPRPAEASVDTEPAGPRSLSACQLRLTPDIAVIEILAPVTGADGCGIDDPVRLSAVMTKDKTRIPVSPPVMLGCAMAEALAGWVREDVANIATTLGSPLIGLSSGQGYQCRGRNGIAGAPTSQHGRGNAMDLRAILLANGTSANPTDTDLPKDFRERIKASACARFTTVLGPDSDGHHDIYIHLDVAPRRNGIRICQWAVHDDAGAVPLPRERPAEAPPRAP